jgi:hypothetical protein
MTSHGLTCVSAIVTKPEVAGYTMKLRESWALAYSHGLNANGKAYLYANSPQGTPGLRGLGARPHAHCRACSLLKQQLKLIFIHPNHLVKPLLVVHGDRVGFLVEFSR